jgi:hypothetical protein
MANQKISELPINNSPDINGLSVVVDNGTTYKTTLNALRSKLVDSGSHFFSGSQVISGSLSISGSILFENSARIIPDFYETGSISIVAGHEKYAELVSHNEQSFIWVDDDGVYIGTDWDTYGRQWTFGHDTGFRSYDIFPNNDSEHDIGSDVLKWRDIYTLGLSVNTITGQSATFSGLLSIQGVNENVFVDGGFSGNRNFDFTSGSIYYITGLTGNGTWNVNNVPEVNNKATTFTYVVVQGSTPYSGSQYQINNTNVTVKWIDGVIPSGSANNTDVIGLSAFRINSSWDVYGTLTTFG